VKFRVDILNDCSDKLYVIHFAASAVHDVRYAIRLMRNFTSSAGHI